MGSYILNERKVPYRHLLSQWVPTGIYVAFIQGFGLSPSLRFGDASIFYCNRFYFPQCRHGLAGTPNRVVDMNETSNPKVSLEPWRLLRRLIGEELSMPFVSYGALAGRQCSNGARLAIQYCCFLCNHACRKSFRPGDEPFIFSSAPPRNIRPLLIGSRTYDFRFKHLSEVSCSRCKHFIQCFQNLQICFVFSVLFRSSHLTNPHFLPAFQSIPPTRTGTVNPQNKSVYTIYPANWYTIGILTLPFRNVLAGCVMTSDNQENYKMKTVPGMII